jgi:hypothetical protein
VSKPVLHSIAFTHEEAAILLALLVYAKSNNGLGFLTDEGVDHLPAMIDEAKELTDWFAEGKQA